MKQTNFFFKFSISSINFHGRHQLLDVYLLEKRIQTDMNILIHD